MFEMLASAKNQKPSSHRNTPAGSPTAFHTCAADVPSVPRKAAGNIFGASDPTAMNVSDVYAAGPTATYMPGRCFSVGISPLISRVKYSVYIMNAMLHPNPSNASPPIMMGSPLSRGCECSSPAASGPRTRKG
ncbi:hypothetical protein UCDDS831_g08101 [Diplodia seriata]|uniref:Uncharacterized protein n=1 Tax=Diplodia seriata TaxID=420778 RepID=A0A0G2DUR3_9PEZI|nr:hypothetical protein UCDDS831_g08101 [Diplodia seriata]